MNLWRQLLAFVIRFPVNLNRIIKYLLSFLKTNWELEDYPLESVTNHQFLNLENYETYEVVPHVVYISNWFSLFGEGNTKEEAYAELKRKFALRKNSPEPLPRPGTEAPISFASRELVSQYEEFIDEFFTKILKLDYSKAFITDLSSLGDFPDDVKDYQRRIALIYKVDVTDIESGNLVEIFDRIYKKKQIK